MKLSYWDSEDYVFYLRGRQVGGIRQLSKGIREVINYEVRSPKGEKGIFFSLCDLSCGGFCLQRVGRR